MSSSAFAELLTALPSHTIDYLRQVETRLGKCADGYGEPLSTYVTQTNSAGGKRLRPLLVLLAAGLEETTQPEMLVYQATAVELLHAATLVHDDILDQAPLRRGRATVFASAGRQVATATGDFLFAQAFRELLLTRDAQAVHVLAKASEQLVLGECMQRQDAWNKTLPTERYFQRCRQKTASLFVAAVKLGAGAASTDSSDSAFDHQLAEFAGNLGLAFQVFDDMLDITGSTQQLGKQRGADLLDGTVTLPLIFAFESSSQLQQLNLREIKTGTQAAEVCDLVKETDALERSQTVADQLIESANQAIMGLPRGQQELLTLAATLAIRRYQ